jgi:hypothetical protein
MAVYATMLKPDTGGVNVKAWIDAQTGSTVNWCAVTTYGKYVLIVIDKS